MHLGRLGRQLAEQLGNSVGCETESDLKPTLDASTSISSGTPVWQNRAVATGKAHLMT
jgi:hypothetical protein